VLREIFAVLGGLCCLDGNLKLLCWIGELIFNIISVKNYLFGIQIVIVMEANFI